MCPIGPPDLPDDDPIDTTYLERLRVELEGEDDDDPVAELIEVFLRNAARLRDELEAALTRGDTEALAEGAHQLVSTSGWVGALSVAEAARGLESVCRSEGLAAARRALPPLLSGLARAADALRAIKAASGSEGRS